MCARLIGRVLVCVALAFAATAAALQTARMALPVTLANGAERIEASGFGGLNRGRYELAGFSGDFTRIESRWAVVDPLFAAARAKSSFTLQGPGIDTRVAAECHMKEGTVTIGLVTFDPKKMTYQCTFTRGGAPMNATFVLGEVKSDTLRARLLARADRRGEAVIDGVRVTLRSEHRFEGSRLQSAVPIGYVLEVEDRAVAALELTDVNPTLFLAPELAPESRDAVLVAALAVAVLRDPENSALAD